MIDAKPSSSVVSVFAAFTVISTITAGSGAARAQTADDSGLNGHRLRVGIGTSVGAEYLGSLFQTISTPNETGGEDIGLGIPNPGFRGIKADYTFFRPNRHEALVSLYLFRTFYGVYKLGGTNAAAAQTLTFETVTQYKTVAAVVPEYRVRFFGHGIGYVGMGIGAANHGLIFPGNCGIVTGAVGADVPGGFYIEARSVYFRREDAAFTSLFVGRRI